MLNLNIVRNENTRCCTSQYQHLRSCIIKLKMPHAMKIIWRICKNLSSKQISIHTFIHIVIHLKQHLIFQKYRKVWIWDNFHHNLIINKYWYCNFGISINYFIVHFNSYQSSIWRQSKKIPRDTLTHLQTDVPRKSRQTLSFRFKAIRWPPRVSMRSRNYPLRHIRCIWE